MAAIVVDLLPTHPALDLAERATVTADVVAFVVAQVQRLPDFLRVPYGMAMLAFESLPLVRWARPFRSLDDGRRQAYLARWGASDLGPIRNVMKLIRSCMLLAYYDHPFVRARLDAAAASSADPSAERRSSGGVA